MTSEVLIVAITSIAGVSGAAIGAVIAWRIQRRSESAAARPHFTLTRDETDGQQELELQNIGRGPAINITVTLSIEAYPSLSTREHRLGPFPDCAAEGRIELKLAELPTTFLAGLSRPVAIDLVVSYDDLSNFGRRQNLNATLK